MKQTSPSRARLLGFWPLGGAHDPMLARGPSVIAGAILGMAVAVVAATGYLAQMPARAEARMVLGTVEPLPVLANGTRPGLGTETATLDMLAARTLDGSRPNQRFKRLRQLLTGRHAAQALRRTPRLAAALFPQRRRAGAPGWHPPSGLSGTVRAWLAPLAGGRATWRPTTREIAQALAGQLAFAQKRDAGLMQVSLRHENPDTARRILAKIRSAAGDRLHALADARTGQAVEKLRDRLAAASDARHRKALAGLLRRYELARVRLTGPDGYAARTIAAPAASSYPRYPRPALVLGGSGLGGLLLGAGAGAALNRRRQRAAPASEGPA